MAEITIKVNGVKVEASRKNLISVDETPDGVAFSFKGGLQIHYMNPHMPSSAKQIVKNTADNFTEKRLIFELDNAKLPAMVDAT